MGTRFSAHFQTGSGSHPVSCTTDTGSFPGVRSGRGVTLTPHPLLVPWPRKSRVIPLLPLRAVRPVQSLSACIRVHSTLTFIAYEASQVFAFTLRHFYGMQIKRFRCSFAVLLVMLHCLCMLMTSGIPKHCHNDMLQGGGLSAAQWDWSSQGR